MSIQQSSVVVLCILIGSLALCSGGCGPKEQIAKYKIRKDKSDFLEKMTQATPEKKPVESRMVVGLVQAAQDCWFFKVHGPKSQVTATEKQWREFLASVRIENAVPKWETPEGWKMKAVSRMAASAGGYANFQINSEDPPLLLKISRLGGQQDLFQNATRWRGQLGLPPIARQDAQSQYVKTEYADGKMILFDHSGSGGSGGMGAPFMGGAGKMPAGHGKKTTPNKKQDTEIPEFTFDIPDGWQQEQDAPVVLVRLFKKDAAEQIAISATRMPPELNDWNTNVKQWVTDITAGKLTEDEIKQQTKRIQIDGVDAQQILLNSTNSEKPESIVGVMFAKQNFTWFVKMKGETETVKASMSDLDTFLNSIKVK